MKSSSRVVVTGVGCVSVIGDTATAMMDGLLEGRSGIGRLRRQPAAIYPTIGGELAETIFADQIASWPEPLAARAQSVLEQSTRPGRLLALSVFQALNSADALHLSGEQMGHLLGTHNANERFIFDQALQWETCPGAADPLYGMTLFDTDIAAASNEIFGIRGPSFTVGGACASSNIALVVALDLLRRGCASRLVVTGASMLSPLALQGWSFIEALSTETFIDEPHRASRPFDRCREGFVPAEGAGAVVLETLAEAKRRDAPILAEICGGAITSAASRGTRTDVDAQTSAIEGAMDDAGLEPCEIDYINAHGTSTPLGDINEMAAVRSALGERAQTVLINSSKSMLGHTLQAAGILEMIATIGQMRRGVVHPTLNLDNPDPAFQDLNLVRGEPRFCAINVALSNAFGFGGMNAVVAVARVDRQRWRSAAK